MTGDFAYNGIYMEKAMDSMGRMLETAVYDLKQDADSFFALFISSGCASLFACGDVRTIAGMSGSELAYSVMEKSGLRAERTVQRFSNTVSPEMTAGRCLAYYQWKTSLPFEEITAAAPVSEIIGLCGPDATDGEICSRIDSRVRSRFHETRLKTLRLQSGMSQSRLAEVSGIPLRTIQQYEQRQKNINKAQFEYLIRFASALNCDPADLYERSVSFD